MMLLSVIYANGDSTSRILAPQCTWVLFLHALIQMCLVSQLLGPLSELTTGKWNSVTRGMESPILGVDDPNHRGVMIVVFR